LIEPKTLEDLLLFATYLAPGIVILWARPRFLTGRMTVGKDAALSYVTLSLVFLVLVQVLLVVTTGSFHVPVSLSAWWLLVSLIGSAVFGALLGIEAANGWSRRLLSKVGVRIAAAHDTAWDWTFSRLKPCFVIVTLKDGTVIGGWCGERSFIGSDPARRDLLLEQA